MATISYDSPHSSRSKDTARAHLFLAMHCAAPLTSPSRHLIENVDVVTIGRGSSLLVRRSGDETKQTLHIALADGHVSTSHARILREGAAWVFEDAGSKNGSFINGAPQRRATLSDGDVVRIGETLLIFRASLLTSALAPLDLEGNARVPALATLLPSLARDFDALASVAASDVPILLVSETGTGKEIVARAVHQLSRRAGSFVPLNCGALPSTLAESVLFGHKKGAFSGATADHAGLFRAADGGTLLLDELGDMPLALQPTLLRALQEGEVLPVGASAPVAFSARFIGATHYDLEASVARGSFREDLLARLSGFLFRLPPLRERREDVGLLTSALLRKIVGPGGKSPSLSAEAGLLLLRYAWPRNVRELEKCLARAVVLAGEDVIEGRHLPPELRGSSVGVGAPGEKASESEKQGDPRVRLIALLVEHGGNVQAVADALHTSRSQVHRSIKKFGIDLSAYRT